MPFRSDLQTIWIPVIHIFNPPITSIIFCFVFKVSIFKRIFTDCDGMKQIKHTHTQRISTKQNMLKSPLFSLNMAFGVGSALTLKIQIHPVLFQLLIFIMIRQEMILWIGLTKAIHCSYLVQFHRTHCSPKTPPTGLRHQCPDF